MAGKKIGIVLALDGEKQFTQGIQNAKKETASLKAELKNLAVEYEGNANSLEYLQKKQDVLTRQQGTYDKKLKQAQEGLNKANSNLHKQSLRLVELQNELKQASNALDEMRQSGKEGTKEYTKQEKKVKDLADAVNRQTLARQREIGSVSDWNKKIYESEAELKKVNREIKNNEKYLDEAKNSTDKCAKSIDEYGDSIERAQKTESTWIGAAKEGLMEAVASKGLDTAMNVLSSGMGAIKDSMYDLSSASAKLSASTGLSEASAKRYEKVMKQIRGDNFGEDYQDVASAMGEVIQIMGELDDADMTNITESAITLRDTFGMDVNESIRAVDVMAKTMGVDAAAAFDLIAKGAQNGLNRSGELTDNLTEYAQLWGQAGFSAEEMFAILENGLDSGAYNLDKVNDYVKEFGISLADGRVEKNLDSFSDGTKNLFREWENGNASTRDVFYSVISDLESMENQQEALTIASETWSSLGEDNAMQVLTALNDVNDGYKNVKGTMESLKEVQYSDLESAVSELGAAIQEKFLTPIASALEGPVTTAITAVTDAISGLGEDTEIPKSQVQELVDSVAAANEKIANTVSETEGIVESAGTEAENIGVLGERLLKLNSIEKKTLSQKSEMSAIVQKLSEYIPEIASAYDEEAGTMNKSNTELQGMIDNTKRLLIVQAQQQAMQQLISQELEAQVQLNRANAAEAEVIDQIGLLKEEQKLMESLYASGEIDPDTYNAKMLEYWNQRLQDCTISQEAYNEIVNSGAYTYDMYLDRMQATGVALDERNKAMTEVTRNSKDAQDALGDLKQQEEEITKACDDWAKSMGISLDASDDLSETTEELTDNTKEGWAAFKQEQEAVDDLPPSLGEAARKTLGYIGTQKDLSEATEEAAKAARQSADIAAKAAEAGSSAQKEAYQSMLDTYNSTVEAIKSDIQDKINPFEKFSGGTDMTVEDMLSNLQSQTDAMDTYAENMQAVTDAMGNDIAPEFLKYIRDMGMDGANMLQHMADTLKQENGKELLKQLSDEYIEGLDKSKEIAKAQAANEMALKASMGELGSSESDFQGLRDNISSAISDAIGDTDSAWNGISENTKRALDDAMAIAQECGAQIPEGLAEGIASGEVSPEEAIAQLNGSVKGSLNGLLEAAKESGIDIPEKVAAGISAGGQSAVDAYNELISLLSAAKADAEAAGKEGGTAVANSYVSGMESGAENASSAGSTLSESAASSAGKNKSDFSTAGKTAASQYASSVKGSASVAVQAAGSMASRSAAAVRSWQNSFYSAGVSMASGVASGIAAGQSRAVSAAARMAIEALQAAKRELEINSPSKKFKQDVGRQIASGMAFGIRDNASLAGREASRMSNTVYTRAVSWMRNYKQDHKTSLDDEIYYWQQVLKHVKKGTSAYNRAMGNLNRVMGYQVGSRDLAQQINSNFGVSRTQRSGNNTTRLSDADYYGEVYSAAAQYLRNYQLLNDMSLQQQQAYWRNVRNNLKRGTQAWYDATSQINDLQEQIEQAQQDRLTTRANVQQSILDKYKVYYRVSARAEMQYWDAARRQFRAGTDERIEADQRYFDAQQEYYDQRRELDEDYAEESQRINDQLIEDVEELQEAYKDAVQSRKEDILSQMNLFEAWDSSGYDGDTLLYNLRTQVAGLALWEQQLNELSNKPISTALLDELREMGPDAAASIYSLNQMTAEQLAEYNQLWERRNALAESQAVSENEQLRQETNQQIAQLRADARAELNALNTEYRSALAELNTGMGTELRNLVNQAATAGEDAVSGLIAGIGRAANSVETYQSTTQVVNRLTSQLSYLPREGRTIGTNTLNGILNGLADYAKIENTSKAVIQSIKRAMEEEADIRSPSKLFEKAIGQQVPAGVAIGMEDSTKDAAKSAKEMMQDTLAAAQEEMRKQHDALQTQAALLDYSGVSRLNRLMETPVQQNTVVNVDNGGLMSLMGTLVSAVNGLSEKMDNQQVVMDTGALVGAIQPAMSQESAAVTVRRNRGRKI